LKTKFIFITYFYPHFSLVLALDPHISVCWSMVYMRKLSIFSILLVGLVLIGSGVWWLRSSPQDQATDTSKPLQEIQEIGITQDVLTGSVVFATPEGLQQIVIASGEVRPLGGSFARLPDTVQEIQQSADGSYWIITSTAEGKSKSWYVVDWQKNKLQRLNETFEKHIGQERGAVSQILVGTNNTAIIATTDVTTTTPENATGQQSYALSTLALASLKFQDFGSVSTTNLELLSYDAAQNEVIFSHTPNDATIVSGKRYNSNQRYDLVNDADRYLSGSQPEQMLEFLGNTVQLTNLLSQETVASISPEVGYIFEPTVYWAPSGEVFALIAYKPDAIEQKRVTFYAKMGSRLYSQAVTGSATVLFSASGQSAVVSTAFEAAVPSDTSQTPTTYQLSKPYEGSSQIFSNLPTTSQIVGVF
jgi:hypothetical protein